MCDSSHRYTVEDEAQHTVLYTGADRDEAISALVTLRFSGECGHLTATHTDGLPAAYGLVPAGYCSEETCLLEDEAIKAWAEQDRQWQNACETFHGEGPYAIANQD